MSDSAELIRSAYAAFAEGDVPTIIGIVGERAEWDVTTVIPQGGSWRGPDGVAEFFEGLGEAWADLTLQLEQMIDDGENVVAVGHAAGRLRAADNAAAGYKFVHIFTVADGKVTRFREWADPDEELRAHAR
jgi:ketosteroid isomerase-like protein